MSNMGMKDYKVTKVPKSAELLEDKLNMFFDRLTEHGRRVATVDYNQDLTEAMVGHYKDDSVSYEGLEDLTKATEDSFTEIINKGYK